MTDDTSNAMSAMLMSLMESEQALHKQLGNQQSPQESKGKDQTAPSNGTSAVAIPLGDHPTSAQFASSEFDENEPSFRPTQKFGANAAEPIMAEPGEFYVPPDQAQRPEIKPLLSAFNEGRDPESTGEQSSSFYDSIMEKLGSVYESVRKPATMLGAGVAMYGALSGPVSVMKQGFLHQGSDTPYSMYMAGKFSEMKKAEDELMVPTHHEDQALVGKAAGGEVGGSQEGSIWKSIGDAAQKLTLGLGMWSALMAPPTKLQSEFMKGSEFAAPISAPLKASVGLGDAYSRFKKKSDGDYKADEHFTKAENVVGRADGGWINQTVGTPGRDSEPTLMEPGGYVIKADNAQKPDVAPFLEAIGKMHDGGQVGGDTPQMQIPEPEWKMQQPTLDQMSSMLPPPPAPAKEKSEPSEIDKLKRLAQMLGGFGAGIGAGLLGSNLLGGGKSGWEAHPELHQAVYGRRPQVAQEEPSFMGSGMQGLNGIGSMMGDFGKISGLAGSIFGSGGMEGGEDKGDGGMLSKAGMLAMLVAAPAFAPLLAGGAEAGGAAGMFGGLFGSAESGGAAGATGGMGEMFGGKNLLSQMFGSVGEKSQSTADVGGSGTGSSIGDLIKSILELIGVLKGQTSDGDNFTPTLANALPGMKTGKQQGANYGAIMRNTGR